ncbi:hypothetical protein [Scytonema millei]|uniref:hypothetical protein n=1 Tax=Scytonema millei TaxID=1245922 RepID=UPI0005849693|nr:hypothetical protein [Scytonema millei]
MSFDFAISSYWWDARTQILAFWMDKIGQLYSVLAIGLDINFIDRIILPQFYNGADRRSLFVGSRGRELRELREQREQ